MSSRPSPNGNSNGTVASSNPGAGEIGATNTTAGSGRVWQRGNPTKSRHEFRRAGDVTLRPGSTPTNDMSTLLENTKKAAQKTTTFHAVRNVQWRGQRYKDATFEVDAADLADKLIVAWLAAGWIEEIRDGQRVQATATAPVSPTAKKIPQTVSAELIPGNAAPLTRAGRFQIVARAAIRPSPYNPRKDFTSVEAQAYLRELAASIREQGIIEPLIVRPLPGAKAADGKFELVAGECRWRGADLADLEQVPCIVRQLNDVEVIEIQTIENLQRRNINPMEEAQGYELLMRKGSYKMADLVKKTSKSEGRDLRAAQAARRAAGASAKPSRKTGSPPARANWWPARKSNTGGLSWTPSCTRKATSRGEEPGGVLSFRQAKQWLETYRLRVQRETEWQAKVKASPLAKTAAKVLTADESDKVVSYGYVRDPQKYVLPTYVCPGDPKQRTYAEVAEAAGRQLPAPVLARDLASGKPLPVLPRAETEKALAGLVPTGEDLRRQREQETERLQLETKTANAKREEIGRRKAERVQGALLACIEHPWSAANGRIVSALCRRCDDGVVPSERRGRDDRRAAGIRRAVGERR